MRLDGAVLVGHNLRFDLSFLTAECNQVGYSFPAMPALCTLRLAWTSPREVDTGVMRPWSMVAS